MFGQLWGNVDADQVRSSIARKLGMDVAGLIPSDRYEGVVEMMIDADGTEGEQYTFIKYRMSSRLGASDYKADIFPLLFFKHISDVFDEEYSLAWEESEICRFEIPAGYQWQNVRETTVNVGQALVSLNSHYLI